jgi:hypothetical protein
MTLTHCWIQKFLSRHSASVAKAVISPQEFPHLQTSRYYLDKYISLLKAYIPLVPSELTFHLDETRLSDWEERRSKPVLVAADAASRPLHYSVGRGIRYETLL